MLTRAQKSEKKTNILLSIIRANIANGRGNTGLIQGFFFLIFDFNLHKGVYVLMAIICNRELLRILRFLNIRD